MIFCDNGCCEIQTRPFQWDYSKKWGTSNRKKKVLRAGILIYDPSERRVLLVQSYGHLWGAPKGQLEDDEDIVDGALRELKEETGITVSKSRLKNKRPFRINNTRYFFLRMNSKNMNINVIDDNDATGASWVKLECVLSLRSDKTPRAQSNLSMHAKTLMKHFFGMQIS